MATPMRSVSVTSFLVLLIATLGCISCTSWRVETLAPASVVVTKKPSQIRVTRADSSQVVLDHPVVRGDSLSGNVGRGVAGNGNISMPLTTVQRLETPHFSPVKMFAIIFGLLALTFLTGSR